MYCRCRHTTHQQASTTQGILLSAVKGNVESQLTHGSNFPSSDKSESSDKSQSSEDDDEDGVITNGISADALVNFFDNNDNELDLDLAKMEEGLGNLNDYSSNQFNLNEHCHCFMDWAVITSQNHNGEQRSSG